MTFTKTYYRTEYFDNGYGFSGYASVSISVPLVWCGHDISRIDVRSNTCGVCNMPFEEAEDNAITRVEDLTEKQIEQKREEMLSALREELKASHINESAFMDYAFGMDFRGISKRTLKKYESFESQNLTDLRYLDMWDNILQSIDGIPIPDLVDAGYKWEISDANGNIIEACKCGNDGHPKPDETGQLGSNSSKVGTEGTESDTGESPTGESDSVKGEMDP